MLKPETNCQGSGTQVLIFVKYDQLGLSTKESPFEGHCAKVSHDALTGTPNRNEHTGHKDD